ncbi:T9SS C-terminal target domain-containing protein [candidate division KSB1 bacterium]|nr:MAG: T9SS C-terminal target domain-containing protein [candidate division KSB1 bacterium]MCE7942559.1 T9SS C-terminal target domain-containing protein [Chlorobi bacterium CHB1]MDL1878138.1 T9SS type A sorting domain-containing protein [Cytophagia bacterium CHB2]
MKSVRLVGLSLLAFSLALKPAAAQTKDPAALHKVNFTSSNLPIVVIDTHGQAIPDEPKIAADMGIIYNGPGVRNNLTDPFNHYNGKIAIEIRGSSSQQFPKKQYGFETKDAQGEDLDVSLLNMPEEADWILSASYSDKTLMRNVLAYKLANDMGRYASRTQFCEVVLNGDYHGVYMLMEKIKRDKNRVNISKMEPTDISGDALTGGYIIKIDKLEGSDTDGWYSTFLPYPGAWQRIYYQYDTPKLEDLAPEQISYIKNFVFTFENLMTKPEYADPQNGYAQYIDIDSFVDYFILNEISRNVDGYRLSTFMHKDRDSKGGKLKMGPAWDYDLAFGNADYYNGAMLADWQVDFRVQSDGFQIPFWWQKLLQDSTFTNRVYARWRELRPNVLEISRVHAYLDSMAAYIDEAQKRNFERWPILGTYVWPNAFIGQTYAEELNYLKEWLNLRMLWMEARIPGKPSSVDENNGFAPEDFMLEQNYPNPFNPATTIAFYLPRSGRVSLKIIDVAGREVMTLADRFMKAGRHEATFEAQGIASGVYFYRLQMGDFSLTKKLVLSQ